MPESETKRLLRDLATYLAEQLANEPHVSPHEHPDTTQLLERVQAEHAYAQDYLPILNGDSPDHLAGRLERVGLHIDRMAEEARPASKVAHYRAALTHLTRMRASLRRAGAR